MTYFEKYMYVNMFKNMLDVFVRNGNILCSFEIINKEIVV